MIQQTEKEGKALIMCKKQTKLNLAIVLIAMALCTAGVCWSVPMGTAFTYQGLLIDANGLAEGLYDFQFSMYDSLSDGNQVSDDVNKLDVDVIEGYFTVELDFGSSVYDGNSLWLEISVRPGGGGPACPEICDDGYDNDGDGLTDCDDPDCFGPGCPEICSDGYDNDIDGFVDCDDPDCFGAPACLETCDDGIDNDGDGLVDCNDPDCFSAGYCDDSHEDNDDMANATQGVSNETGLISAYLDQDWFAIEVCAGGTIDVDILFTNANGDIDLYLIDSESTVLDSGLTSTDNETVSWTNSGSAATVYIVVQMYTVDAINTYDLSSVIGGCQ
jgi:hypothetical protein